MQLFFPTIAAQFDVFGGTLGMVVAVAVSFLAITLVSSYYRFQHIVQMAEDTQPEDMGAVPEDILRVQLARYLAGCARRGTSFSISLIRMQLSDADVRMDSPFIEAIKQAARCGDITCIFDDHTAALLTEAEAEDSEVILTRIIASVARSNAGVTLDQLRVGIASYPGHGLSGKDLLQVATDGLGQATVQNPVVMREIVDLDAEDDEEVPAEVEEPAGGEEAEEAAPEEEGRSKGWKQRRKNAMLDDLTGVLKPSAISAYMQRVMSDLRRKKERVALFCIGVNNIEHISRIHGKEAADDVLVGISKILQDNLRAEDLIGRHEKYAFLVLAQASHDEAEIIGKRISTLVQQSEFVSGGRKIKTTIVLGVATFPEHGRNLHHLYMAGQKVLDHSRANDIRAYAVYDPEIHDKVASKPMRSIKSIQD